MKESQKDYIIEKLKTENYVLVISGTIIYYSEFTFYFVSLWRKNKLVKITKRLLNSLLVYHREEKIYYFLGFDFNSIRLIKFGDYIQKTRLRKTHDSGEIREYA